MRSDTKSVELNRKEQLRTALSVARSKTIFCVDGFTPFTRRSVGISAMWDERKSTGSFTRPWVGRC